MFVYLQIFSTTNYSIKSDKQGHYQESESRTGYHYFKYYNYGYLCLIEYSMAGKILHLKNELFVFVTQQA